MKVTKQLYTHILFSFFAGTTPVVAQHDQAKQPEPWESKCQVAVSRVWHPNSFTHTVILFVALDRWGSTRTCKIIQSSGNDSVDRSILRNIRFCRFPRPPLTKSVEVNRFSFEIELTPEYARKCYELYTKTKATSTFDEELGSMTELMHELRN